MTSARYAAVVEPGRIQLRALPSLEPIGEIGIDGDASSNDVVFVDDSWLIVLSRDGGSARMHVVDSDGFAKLGEIEVAPRARILATSGHMVLVADTSAVVIDSIALTKRALPMRSAIIAAGALEPRGFVIASRAALEEWDAETCAPVRRLRVERPLHPEHVGGDGRRIWLASGDRLEVISPASRRTWQTALPEPVARVITLGDTLAIVGASTRSVFLVDLGAESAPVRLDCGPVIDVDRADATTLVGITASGEPFLIEASHSSERPSRTHRRLAAEPTTVEGGWRAELASWGRGGKRPLLVDSALTELAERCEGMRPAIELLYAARLLGQHGVPPVDLASALGWRWDEVLGGRLDGLVRSSNSRCYLVAEAIAMLDEQPPLSGTIVDGGTAQMQSVALLAAPELDLDVIATWAAPIVGSVFAPNARGLAKPTRFLAEARWRGLIPLVPWMRWKHLLAHPPTTAVFVVGSTDEARELDVPVVAEVSPRPLDDLHLAESTCHA